MSQLQPAADATARNRLDTGLRRQKKISTGFRIVATVAALNVSGGIIVCAGAVGVQALDLVRNDMAPLTRTMAIGGFLAAGGGAAMLTLSAGALGLCEQRRRNLQSMQYTLILRNSRELLTPSAKR